MLKLYKIKGEEMFSAFTQKYITPKNVLFFIGLILFLILISKVPDITIMFFASYVVACSMEPLVQKLMPKMQRATASAIILLCCILIIMLLFIPLLVIGANEVKTFADSFPQYIDLLKNFITNTPLLSHVDMGGIITSASGVSSKILTQTFTLGKSLGSAFVYLLVSILIIYYFMSDKENIKNTFLKLFPTPMRKRTSEIYDSISLKIGGYVVAQIATMASIGVIITIGLMILKLDYALLLGFISALLDIIPIVGPTIAFAICLIAVYKFGPVALILTAIIFGVAQLIENNFVRPFVFSKILNIHPLLVLLFIFLAAKFFGIIGVVFAPAIAALFVVLIEEIYMKSIE